jgi:hypothetical protein
MRQHVLVGENYVSGFREECPEGRYLDRLVAVMELYRNFDYNPSGGTTLLDHITKLIHVIQSPFSQNGTNQPPDCKVQRLAGFSFRAHKASYNAQLLSDDKSSGRKNRFR